MTTRIRGALDSKTIYDGKNILFFILEIDKHIYLYIFMCVCIYIYIDTARNVGFIYIVLNMHYKYVT